MELIEEINLDNGLKLNIFDLSRSIATDTVKVEIAIQAKINLKESYFSDRHDYHQVKNIFGDKLAYEHRIERAFVSKDTQDAVRQELINTFKINSLNYIAAKKSPLKLALAMLKEIKNNPYKYQGRPDSHLEE